MTKEIFLVTGALGFIGAWVVRNLMQADVPVVAFDVGSDAHRLKAILSAEQLAKLALVQGDITQLAEVERVLDEHSITHIVHLAALLLPACKANPVLGERVNVGGTVNMFEAAAKRNVQRVVFASSIAIFDTADVPTSGVVTHDVAGRPTNLYGVYKQAMEGIARVFWQEQGISSIGLRPATVFGVGRDNGITATPTKAMHAAARGLPFHIPYGGRGEFQYVDDVAKTFIACARAPFAGAEVFNLHGSVAHMREVITAIENAAPDARGKITFDVPGFPSPEEFDASPLANVIGAVPCTPLDEAVRMTVEMFRRDEG
jgi:nucleoside-diphosphate-sugar epimerase